MHPGEVIWQNSTALTLARTLNANTLAAEVDRMVQAAWRRFVRTLHAPTISSDLAEKIEALIRRRCIAYGREAWEHMASAAIEAIPRPVLLWIARQAAGNVDQSAPRGMRERLVMPRGATADERALFKPPTDAQIDAALDTVRSSVRGEWSARFKNWAAEEQAITDAIRSGLALGKGRAAIAREIRPLVGGNKVAAERLARTQTHEITVSMSMKAQQDAFGSMIRSWRYRATLDDRVRPEHAARDGKEYAVGEPRPWLPDGWNCRCSYDAVLGTAEDVGLPSWVDDMLAPRERAAMGEPWKPGKDQDIDFSSWFDQRAPKEQRSYLGARLFDSLPKRAGGRVSWDRAIEVMGYRDAGELATIKATAPLPPKAARQPKASRQPKPAKRASVEPEIDPAPVDATTRKPKHGSTFGLKVPGDAKKETAAERRAKEWERDLALIDHATILEDFQALARRLRRGAKTAEDRGRAEAAIRRNAGRIPGAAAWLDGA